MPKDNIKRICLWSGPRNISTALMYSFAQRCDIKVYDEPLYGYYLSHNEAREYHPGSQDIMSLMENDGHKVIEMMMGKQDKPVVFFKNMTHHLLNLDRTFMKGIVNIILTRDPVEMLPSFAKVIHLPTMHDVGYKLHAELVNYFHKMNINYIVLDSKKILLNPKKVLSHLCDICDLPFDENMLQWKEGARPEDGIWSKYWYTNIHKSNGFIKYKTKTESFPDKLKPLLNSCIPYYEQLLKLAIG